jgi:CDP-4-dehydro-6-deoxyglucose reductase
MAIFFKKKDLEVELSPSLQRLKLKTGDNLLASALDHGIKWPHLCRVGSCGTCRCKLVKGKISPEIDFENVLSQAQLKDGYILACKSSVKTDLVVEVTLQNET